MIYTDFFYTEDQDVQQKWIRNGNGKNFVPTKNTRVEFLIDLGYQ